MGRIIEDKKVQEMLGAALMHFKVVKNNDTLRQEVSDMKQKWLGKDEISDNMKQDVVLPFAEQLSLSAAASFEILDTYFTANEKNLRYFMTVEQKVKELNE